MLALKSNLIRFDAHKYFCSGGEIVSEGIFNFVWKSLLWLQRCGVGKLVEKLFRKIQHPLDAAFSQFVCVCVFMYVCVCK